MTYELPPAPVKPVYSLPSILAIISAICSFRFGALGGFMLAIGAILFGLLGVVIGMMPTRRGAILSIFSIFLGVIGIVAAIFKLIL